MYFQVKIALKNNRYQNSKRALNLKHKNLPRTVVFFYQKDFFIDEANIATPSPKRLNVALGFQNGECFSKITYLLHHKEPSKTIFFLIYIYIYRGKKTDNSHDCTLWNPNPNFAMHWLQPAYWRNHSGKLHLPPIARQSQFQCSINRGSGRHCKMQVTRKRSFSLHVKAVLSFNFN